MMYRYGNGEGMYMAHGKCFHPCQRMGLGFVWLGFGFCLHGLYAKYDIRPNIYSYVARWLIRNTKVVLHKIFKVIE